MFIDSYDFGTIRIEGKEYCRDVIVFPDRVQESWWRKEGHSLCPADLDSVVSASPVIFILGLGYYSAMEVPEDTQMA